MTTLSIVGAGNLGKTLGRVWARNHLVEIHAIVNRSQPSATAAADFIGQGTAVRSYADLRPTDLLMISVGDDAISDCATQLAKAKVVHPNTIVFHCSGSQASNLLEPLRRQGAFTASVHPLKSFADPTVAADTFSGTPCGVEGDQQACDKLGELFTASGGQVFQLQPESKLLYHAATVIVSNYFTALIEAGLRCMASAGIDRHRAMVLLQPLIEETLRNNVRSGTISALTGPIARGDAQLVGRQSQAISGIDPSVARVYNALGLLAIELSRAKGKASAEDLGRIAASLR